MSNSNLSPDVPLKNRFVVLRHDPGDGGRIHWDFLLELCGSEKLASWSFPEPPTTDGLVGEKRFDHRAVYLEYEGEISGNRGTLSRYDAGTFTPSITLNDLESDRVELEFSGRIMRGIFVLEKLEPKREQEQPPEKWCLSRK